jgi:hypothetical protein
LKKVHTLFSNIIKNNSDCCEVISSMCNFRNW